MKSYILASLFILVGCNQRNISDTHTTLTDSTASVIALIPTLDCLPFSLAQESFDSLGLNLKTVVYASQEDAEQALIEGNAICCATDLFRLYRMKQRKHQVKFLFCTQRKWNLAVGKQLRTNRLSQLADRLIGMERQTTSDYICDYIEKQIPKGKLILRPQVAGIATRYDMMVNQQIDAAVLPDPWIAIAHKDGHSVLALPDSLYEGYSGFAVSDSINATLLPILEKAYNNAVTKLKFSSKLHISESLLSAYGLIEIADSINTHEVFHQCTQLIPTKENKAKQWIATH